jgi:hypothetical protein
LIVDFFLVVSLDFKGPYFDDKDHDKHLHDTKTDHLIERVVREEEQDQYSKHEPVELEDVPVYGKRMAFAIQTLCKRAVALLEPVFLYLVLVLPKHVCEEEGHSNVDNEEREDEYAGEHLC